MKYQTQFSENKKIGVNLSSGKYCMQQVKVKIVTGVAVLYDCRTYSHLITLQV